MFLASRAKGKIEGIMYGLIQQGELPPRSVLSAWVGHHWGGHALYAVVICWTQLKTFLEEEHRSKQGGPDGSG